MKHSRIGATGADRVNQFTAGEDGRLAGHYVRRSYRQRNPQLFEGLAAQYLPQKSRHFVVIKDSKAGEAPAGEIFESNQRCNLFQFLGGDAAGIGCPDHRSYASAGYEIDGDVLFFQDLEHADVGQATGKSSA